VKGIEKSNNPRELPKSRFQVRLGDFENFVDYLNSFERAVEILYARVSNAEETPYSMALPLLFLMRHSLELGYKYTLAELHYFNEIPYKLDKYKHSLQDLHSALKEQFNEFVKKWSISREDIEDFERHYCHTGNCMKEFSQIDPNCIAFRYPTQRDGTRVFPHDYAVNLLELKESYDDGMVLLCHLIDTLQPCYEMMEEFHENVDW